MNIPKEIVDKIKQRNNLSKEIEEEVKKWLEENNTYDITVQALGKQLPKKPIEISELYGCVKCPVCQDETSINVFEFDDCYCVNCGQKLDWGEEK